MEQPVNFACLSGSIMQYKSATQGTRIGEQKLAT